jgi:PAS domain S-box-containing protein
METLVNLVAQAEQLVPREMFADGVTQRAAVGFHAALFLIYIGAAAALAWRRERDGKADGFLLGLAVAGAVVSLAGPLMVWALARGALHPAWEGAWHMAAVLPVLLACALRAGRGGAASAPAAAPGADLEEKKLASLLNHASDGIFTLNAQGRIESMNAAAEDFLEVTLSEAAGRPLSALSERVTFFTEDLKPLALHDWAAFRALRDGTIANEQSVHVFSSRRKGLFLKVSASPVRGSSGATEAVICLLKDFTARKQLEILKRELFTGKESRETFAPPAAVSPDGAGEGGALTETAARERPAPAAAGALALAPFLKFFLREHESAAARRDIRLEDHIPAVLPYVDVSPLALKRALSGLVQYAIHATAEGKTVVVRAGSHDGMVGVAIRDGGMDLVSGDVSLSGDDEQKNPFTFLQAAKDELAAMGLKLETGAGNPREGTEYFFRIPAAPSAGVASAWIKGASRPAQNPSPAA